MAGGASELTRLLRELKERSGRSYADLSHRALISRSALHRYCTGKAVPPDAATVVRVTRACGATEEDSRAVLAAWIASQDEQDGSGNDAQPEAEPDPGPAATPVRRRPVVRPRAVAVAVAVLAVVATAGIGLAVRSGGDRGGAAGRPRVAGPAWQVHPKPVDPAFFGVTMNSDTGEMPAFRVGSLRLWDSGTKWSDIQPRRGAYRWATLDRLVAGAEDDGLETTFVLGGTPAWAAPDAPRTAYPDGSRAGPPDDLLDWDRFVGSLARRYKHRIGAYELWNIANDPRYYTGPLDRLAEMTRRASTAIRRADPDARIVCPGVTELWRPESIRVMERFAELGGYRHCDVASVKLHQRRVTDPPEGTLALLATVQRTLHEQGAVLPIWNTGVTYDIPYQSPLPPARTVPYATRFYLTGLYGHVYDLRRAYFYNWGSNRIPVVLQGVGGRPTEAARAVERLQRWLAGARIAACGHGRQSTLPDNAWQCEFRSGSRRLLVRWAHTGSAATTVPHGLTTVSGLDGTTRAVRTGDALTVTGRPVLLTSR